MSAINEARVGTTLTRTGSGGARLVPLMNGWCKSCFGRCVFDLKCECEALPVRHLKAGEVLFEEGGRSGCLYFMISGCVEVSRAGTLVAKIDTPGLVLGEVSILLERSHIAGVKALADCAFHVAEDPEAFLREHPQVCLYLARSLAKKVDVTTCYLVDLKQQYGGQEGQLGMVHEVIESLLLMKC